MNAIATLLRRSQPVTAALDGWLQPVALLAMRLYLARVFFLSGLTKIQDWDTTVFLFTEEYHVPLLSPAVAAALGTAGELLLPPLVTAGPGRALCRAGAVCAEHHGGGELLARAGRQRAGVSPAMGADVAAIAG